MIRPKDIKELAINLYLARRFASDAKSQVVELARTIGHCESLESNPMQGGGVACYQTGIPESEWCDICKQKLPVWKHYRAKKHAAGLALRAVIRAGKRAHMESLNAP